MLELLILLIAALLYWALTSREAVRLNLHICGQETLSPCGRWTLVTIYGDHTMAKIGDVIVARIAPTNAAGAPAPVFNAEWSEAGDSYDFTVSPDGLSATFVAKVAGTLNFVQVTATTKSGASLFAEAALPDVEAAPVDEEAVSLGLTVG